MEQITLRVSKNTKESLKDEAADAGVSLSEHIRNLLENRSDPEKNNSEVTELQERIDELREEREELLRDSVRVEYLEKENERLREERDKAIRKAERNQQKLALHNSEKSWIGRLKDRFS